MKKGVILGIIALVLLCCFAFCALGVYLIATADDNDKKSDDTQKEQQDEDKVAEEVVEDLDTVVAQENFLEEVSSEYEKMQDDRMMQLEGEITGEENGQMLTMGMDISVDGENVAMTMSVDAAEILWLIVDEVTYMSGGSTWYLFQTSGDPADSDPFDSESFTDFEGELDREDYTYKGVKRCRNSRGDCQVFEYAETDGTSTIYINSSKRIDRLEMDTTGSSGYFDVFYKNQRVKAPASFETVTEEEAPFKMLEIMTPFLEASGADF